MNSFPTLTPLESALAYASRGWAVFPLHSVNAAGVCSCGNRECQSRSKHPRSEHGFKDATTDERIIRAWWNAWPEANVAIATGSGSNLVVLDIDPRHGGNESFEELERICGQLPDTLEALTGGGGRHLYFSHPGVPVRSRAGVAGLPGLDVRGEGGYVAAPPSLHASGRCYEWSASSRAGEMQPADLPPSLLNLLSGRSFTANTISEQQPPTVGAILEGERNNKLAQIAGAIRRQGADEPAILAALVGINATQCEPPLPPAEVESIAASIARYESDREHLTDLGNAGRFVRLHGNDVRYCYTSGSWLVWDGTRWAADDTAAVERLAVETIKAIHADALQTGDEGDRRRIAAHATKSEAAPRIRAMLDLARAMVPVKAADLDADPWLLNTRNGTLDLHTGKLRDHAREDLITKLAPVDYRNDASYDGWNAFLQKMIPDAEQRAFLRRAVGYTLTGDTREEVLFFIHGPTAAGKSSFTNAVKNALGDYAATADFETFLRRSSTGVRNDIARLVGRRMVLSLEVDEGRHLAEAIIKDLTGGDPVSARFMYKEFFEFQPQFKLWLVANHRPQVSAEDSAMWRRILLIPFTVSIPDGERDPAVKRSLVESPDARAAILAWAVAGALEWQKDGLGVPQTVRAATQEYREECDRLGAFLSECCVVSETARVGTGELRTAYEAWCQQSGEEPMKSTPFGRKLTERGFQSSKLKGERIRLGLGLLDERPSADGFEFVDRMDKTRAEIPFTKADIPIFPSNLANPPSRANLADYVDLAEWEVADGS